jgi:streptomycin 6-kinase
VPKRMFVVPGDLRRKAVAQHGEEGRAWIERLPIILEHCRQQWNLTCASPVVYPSNAAHYLAQARRRDGTTVVLKAHAPTGEFLQEAEALRLCAGRGMVRSLLLTSFEPRLVMPPLLAWRWRVLFDEEPFGRHDQRSASAPKQALVSKLSRRERDVM